MLNGIGDRNAKIAFVNFCPLKEDLQDGKAFSIRTSEGFMFDQLLNSAGILRRSCWVTNLVKAHLDVPSSVLRFPLRGAPVEGPAFASWKRQLLAELATLPELTIVAAMGQEVFYTLTGLRNIRKRRGSVYEIDLTPERKVKVLAMLHPKTASEEYLTRYLIMSDLKRLREESATRELVRAKYTVHLRPTVYEAIGYIRRCEWERRVGFDIEVLNEELGCFALAISPTECMCIPFVAGGTDFYSLDEETEITKELGFLLENPTVLKIGQNLAFDSCFMLRRYGIRTKNMADTMIAMGMLYPDFNKGLDIITSLFTREPYYKDEGKKYMTMGGDEEQFWLYNAKDALVCVQALPEMEQDLERLECYDAYVRQTQLLQPLMYMQEHGIAVDKEGLAKAHDETFTEMARLQQELNEMAGEELNPNSPKQLINYFYNKKGIKPYVKRGTGTPTVDENALKRLSRKGFREASLVQEIRHLKKMDGTYYTMEFDKDDRLRCAFNPVGTVSGRLSSSKTIFGTGGNLQNIPPNMKKFLVADPGFVIYNIDLVQAENRIVAYVAPDHNMIEAFELGQDIHSKTAGLIFGKPLDQVSDEKGSSSIGSGQYSERFWGKKANHGLNYGMGFKKFAFLYEIPEADAKRICDGYHRAYPGVKAYHDWVTREISTTRRLTNCLGRTRKFLDRYSDSLLMEAYSFIPQSTIADIINQRGLLFIFENQDEFRELRLLNQVHDSLVFQLPLWMTAVGHINILRSICNSLTQPIKFRNRTFTIPVEVEIGLNMKDTDEVSLNSVDALQCKLEELNGRQKA